MSEKFPRCQVVPLPNHQASFVINGTERTRWHFGPQYPRPFFYPLTGPSGKPLTRMGHPGAPNHDHHRSIWFAHQKLLGIDFWSDTSGSQIRQHQWLAYQDDDEAARMAVELKWFDGHDPAELVTQTLIVEVRPGSADSDSDKYHETFVEIQTEFVPTAASIEFQQTNFGFLAVRVAKNISGFFGGGLLTNSARQTTEANIFGKPAQWMDYSGPVSATEDVRSNGARSKSVSQELWEGIAYFDHPLNPGQPTRWHVREDGWMGASPCMDAAIETTQAKPLRLRYLLHGHASRVDADRADRIHREFSESPELSLTKSARQHTEWEIGRVK